MWKGSFIATKLASQHSAGWAPLSCCHQVTLDLFLFHCAQGGEAQRPVCSGIISANTFSEVMFTSVHQRYWIKAGLQAWRRALRLVPGSKSMKTKRWDTNVWRVNGKQVSHVDNRKCCGKTLSADLLYRKWKQSLISTRSTEGNH